MYNLMISHSWHYNEHYNKVVNWLNEGLGETEWKNLSVSADNPLDTTTDRELKEKLSNRVRLSSAIIVLAGMYASYSKWIDYEIDEAIRMNKVIIGVRPWGQERIPKKISDNATITVGWNKNSVVNAVKDYAGKDKSKADREVKNFAYERPNSFRFRYKI